MDRPKLVEDGSITATIGLRCPGGR